MVDIYLTQEELSKLFEAVRKRDMDSLLRQKAELEASVAQAQKSLDANGRWWNEQLQIRGGPSGELEP
jgi:hypothetical protein